MTSPTVTFAQFESATLAQGFDEVLERRWAPGTVLGLHEHPFSLRALVVQGEMWLDLEGETRHLRPGDEFALDTAAPYSERYGPDGATYWVARRNPKP